MAKPFFSFTWTFLLASWLKLEFCLQASNFLIDLPDKSVTVSTEQPTTEQ